LQRITLSHDFAQTASICVRVYVCGYMCVLSSIRDFVVKVLHSIPHQVHGNESVTRME
jgi:hypothetical protein